MLYPYYNVLEYTVTETITRYNCSILFIKLKWVFGGGTLSITINKADHAQILTRRPSTLSDIDFLYI